MSVILVLAARLVKCDRFKPSVSLWPRSACAARRESALGFRVPPASVYVVGGRRPLRAYCGVRAHIAPGKLSAATPAAQHSRHSVKAPYPDR
jgi:hypothetical protein